MVAVGFVARLGGGFAAAAAVWLPASIVAETAPPHGSGEGVYGCSMFCKTQNLKVCLSFYCMQCSKV